METKFAILGVLALLSLCATYFAFSLTREGDSSADFFQMVSLGLLGLLTTGILCFGLGVS